jgi:hypothetical protein
MSPAFRLDLDAIVRRAAIGLAQDQGAQLHAQAQVALDMAAREIEQYGRRLLAAEPTLTAEATIARLAAHLRSILPS